MLRKQLGDLDADPSRRRRQVTVLFADVSGFTAMSEQMDAEKVTEVMNDVWARLDDVVVEHGGRIDKHIGDALMGVWGSEGSTRTTRNKRYEPPSVYAAGARAVSHRFRPWIADAGRCEHRTGCTRVRRFDRGVHGDG